MIPALSLRQPWAWAVVHAGKTIENRRWNTRFRGPFLIHAAKAMTREEYEQACDWIDDARGLTIVPSFDDLPRGGIVGRANLVEVVSPQSDLPPSFRRYPDGEGLAGNMWRWHMPEQWGFVLANIEPIPFKACRGALGFFDPETGRKVA